MSNFYAAISLAGYVMAIAGVGLNFGVGWALLIGGLVLFVAGGLGSAREGQ